MRVSTMIRTASVGIAIAAIAACSDIPAAPHQARSDALQPTGGFLADRSGNHQSRGEQERESKSEAEHYKDKGSAVFTASWTFDVQEGAVLRFGENTLVIPENAVCALNSGYGAGFWNAPCDAYQGSFTVTATWTTRHGHAYVEFAPALRFNPDTKVELLLFDKQASKNKEYTILWRNSAGLWVDESLTDPSLKTVVLNDHVLMRRIKHFSGYNVGAGSCDPLVDPTCPAY